jgi:hypothetical protein
LDREFSACFFAGRSFELRPRLSVAEDDPSKDDMATFKKDLSAWTMR